MYSVWWVWKLYFQRYWPIARAMMKIDLHIFKSVMCGCVDGPERGSCYQRAEGCTNTESQSFCRILYYLYVRLPFINKQCDTSTRVYMLPESSQQSLGGGGGGYWNDRWFSLYYHSNSIVIALSYTSHNGWEEYPNLLPYYIKCMIQICFC